MDRLTTPVEIKKTHDILVNFYHKYGDEVKSHWSSFDRERRLTCAQPHPFDEPDPIAGFFMPEWNIADIIKVNSNHFIELLEARATRSIYDQIFTPYNGLVTDYAFIDRLVQKEGIPSKIISKPRYVTVVDDILSPGKESDGQNDGVAVEIKTKRSRRIAGDRLDLISHRQFRIFYALNTTMQEILKLGRQTKRLKVLPGPETAALASTPGSASYPPSAVNLLNIALENGIIAEELYFNALETPGLLRDHVKGYLECRPELVPDDKGLVTLVPAQKFIGIALFDLLHQESKRVITWQYIYRLLRATRLRPDDKSFRHRILQQISNVCQMEYVRAQDLLRRNLQTRAGRTLFRRCQNTVDSMGNPRTVMKAKKPEASAEPNTQLYYLLCLCHPETVPTESWESFKRLQALHDKHPNRRCLIKNEERRALGVLHTVVSFIHELSLSFRMPSFSRTRENEFVSGIQMEDAKVVQAKPHIDIGRFVHPIEKLLNPSTAAIAIAKLSECVLKAGDGNLYGRYDAVANRCLDHLNGHPCEDKKVPESGPHVDPAARKTVGGVLPKEPKPVGQGNKADSDGIALSRKKDDESAQSPPLEEKSESVQQPTLSKKTAPTRQVLEAKKSDICSLTRAKSKQAPASQCPIDKKTSESRRQGPTAGKKQAHVGSNTTLPPAQAVLPPGKLAVSASAARAFDALFDKSVARGGLHWVSFESAMAELGFQIIHKLGSSVTFAPPKDIGLNRSLTLHRPHGARIEGFRMVVLAQRLNRAFGWDEDTFVVC